MVRLVDMGVDVALITVQVEIVTGIDCASKCYTSHLSFFFPLSFFWLDRRPASQLQRRNCESQGSVFSRQRRFKAHTEMHRWREIRSLLFSREERSLQIIESIA